MAATRANWAKRSSRRAVFGVEIGLGVEVLDFAAELHLEGGGVELLDQADAALAGAAAPCQKLGQVGSQRS